MAYPLSSPGYTTANAQQLQYLQQRALDNGSVSSVPADPLGQYAQQGMTPEQQTYLQQLYGTQAARMMASGVTGAEAYSLLNAERDAVTTVLRQPGMAQELTAQVRMSIEQLEAKQNEVESKNGIFGGIADKAKEWFGYDQDDVWALDPRKLLDLDKAKTSKGVRETLTDVRNGVDQLEQLAQQAAYNPQAMEAYKAKFEEVTGQPLTAETVENLPTALIDQSKLGTAVNDYDQSQRAGKSLLKSVGTGIAVVATLPLLPVSGLIATTAVAAGSGAVIRGIGMNAIDEATQTDASNDFVNNLPKEFALGAIDGGTALIGEGLGNLAGRGVAKVMGTGVDDALTGGVSNAATSKLGAAAAKGASDPLARMGARYAGYTMQQGSTWLQRGVAGAANLTVAGSAEGGVAGGLTAAVEGGDVVAGIVQGATAGVLFRGALTGAGKAVSGTRNALSSAADNGAIAALPAAADSPSSIDARFADYEPGWSVRRYDAESLPAAAAADPNTIEVTSTPVPEGSALSPAATPDSGSAGSTAEPPRVITPKPSPDANQRLVNNKVITLPDNLAPEVSAQFDGWVKGLDEAGAKQAFERLRNSTDPTQTPLYKAYQAGAPVDEALAAYGVDFHAPVETHMAYQSLTEGLTIKERQIPDRHGNRFGFYDNSDNASLKYVSTDGDTLLPSQRSHLRRIQEVYAPFKGLVEIRKVHGEVTVRDAQIQIEQKLKSLNAEFEAQKQRFEAVESAGIEANSATHYYTELSKANSNLDATIDQYYAKTLNEMQQMGVPESQLAQYRNALAQEKIYLIPDDFYAGVRNTVQTSNLDPKTATAQAWLSLLNEADSHGIYSTPVKQRLEVIQAEYPTAREQQAVLADWLGTNAAPTTKAVKQIENAAKRQNMPTEGFYPAYGENAAKNAEAYYVTEFMRDLRNGRTPAADNPLYQSPTLQPAPTPQPAAATPNPLPEGQPPNSPVVNGQPTVLPETATTGQDLKTAVQTQARESITALVHQPVSKPSQIQLQPETQQLLDANRSKILRTHQNSDATGIARFDRGELRKVETALAQLDRLEQQALASGRSDAAQLVRNQMETLVNKSAKGKPVDTVLQQVAQNLKKQFKFADGSEEAAIVEQFQSGQVQVTRLGPELEAVVDRVVTNNLDALDKVNTPEQLTQWRNGLQEQFQKQGVSPAVADELADKVTAPVYASLFPEAVATQTVAVPPQVVAGAPEPVAVNGTDTTQALNGQYSPKGLLAGKPELSNQVGPIVRSSGASSAIQQAARTSIVKTLDSWTGAIDGNQGVVLRQILQDELAKIEGVSNDMAATMAEKTMIQLHQAYGLLDSAQSIAVPSFGDEGFEAVKFLEIDSDFVMPPPERPVSPKPAAVEVESTPVAPEVEANPVPEQAPILLPNNMVIQSKGLEYAIPSAAYQAADDAAKVQLVQQAIKAELQGILDTKGLTSVFTPGAKMSIQRPINRLVSDIDARLANIPSSANPHQELMQLITDYRATVTTMIDKHRMITPNAEKVIKQKLETPLFFAE